MSTLTPEQQESARMCDRLTDAVLGAVGGTPVGVVIGMCLNVLDRAASCLPPEDRKILADRMRLVALDIETPTPTTPGAGN